jgi:hypothetical protein
MLLAAPIHDTIIPVRALLSTEMLFDLIQDGRLFHRFGQGWNTIQKLLDGKGFPQSEFFRNSPYLRLKERKRVCVGKKQKERENSSQQHLKNVK